MWLDPMSLVWLLGWAGGPTLVLVMPCSSEIEHSSAYEALAAEGKQHVPLLLMQHSSLRSSQVLDVASGGGVLSYPSGVETVAIGSGSHAQEWWPPQHTTAAHGTKLSHAQVYTGSYRHLG
ncbi:hypothetical protein COO60DRAFT_822812 [Scenedesmus sp. NREL 46B-D3]|nr:hypothetical protein COO60DRAFT_822812 [Scenedesmus sp. NREL 46B-D3]